MYQWCHTAPYDAISVSRLKFYEAASRMMCFMIIEHLMPTKFYPRRLLWLISCDADR